MDVDDNLVPYVEEIIDQKEVDVDNAYIEALDNYIGAKIFIPVHDYFPDLKKV